MTDILAPIRVGPYELPNRLVMSPMTRCRAGKGNVPGARPIFLDNGLPSADDLVQRFVPADALELFTAFGACSF